MLKQKIEAFCKSIGLDTIGFIPCRTFEELRGFYQERKEKKLENEFEEKDIEKRIHPNHYMEDAKTIISIAFPYYHTEVEGVENGFSIYTKRVDYHRVVKKYLTKICEYIETLGGAAKCFVDSNTLPERYIAYLAGVGFIGRNNMIITKQYGSYVFLGEIMTDLVIECSDKRTLAEISNYNECGECKACFLECPTKAINQVKKNSNICLSYLTQKKELEDYEIKMLKGNVFGCDFCQLKCPYNQKVVTNVIEEFKTLEYMNEDIMSYATMDNKFFKEKISYTSCGWRGKNVIRRNAIVQLNKCGYEVEQLLGESEYINRYIQRITRKEEDKKQE